ncbi:Predicted DNA-binding transcriptional regulator YafY, contains an HTH and WYL domains [Paenimyroides aquimaris]|uniref:Predicted DNA-binding transcriptional regulator YafY, contains an HTH and WYL domains n=1 Tax=Paenimyroides marinum TaxID=1159016 RepID=A0A1H6K608_9FLAO|nr:YafY family protein [Paenimyroides aquimaris]SEH70636.1 Predicted DNA-binding transcriptional regulator YafY, contains an HTH and WYL domains [Paenimyroides aquimaris]
MSSLDTKKFNRILNIYVQLQSRNWITAQQFANRYEVSVRTIYRDMKALENAGVPVYNEPGKGFALVDGYRIPPTIFTKEEAMSFAIAEKLVGKFADKKLSFDFSSALHKMKAILRTSEKENVALIEDQYLIFDSSSSENSEVLSVLLSCIVEKVQLEIFYQKPASDQAERRLLEPIGIFYENDYWYFMAFCYLRNDYRQFRIDRVKQLTKTITLFKNEHQPLEYFLNRKKTVEIPKNTIKIVVPRKMAHYFNWDKNSYGFVSDKEIDSQVEMTFETSLKLEYFARWLLMFSDEATVVEPLKLKQIMGDLLQKALNRM